MTNYFTNFERIKFFTLTGFPGIASMLKISPLESLFFKVLNIAARRSSIYRKSLNCNPLEQSKLLFFKALYSYRYHSLGSCFGP